MNFKPKFFVGMVLGNTNKAKKGSFPTFLFFSFVKKYNIQVFKNESNSYPVRFYEEQTDVSCLKLPKKDKYFFFAMFRKIFVIFLKTRKIRTSTEFSIGPNSSSSHSHEAAHNKLENIELLTIK